MSRPTPLEIHEVAANLDPEFAKAVSRWEVSVGEDSTGDPAIFVTIVFRDAAIHAAWPGRAAFRDRLRDLLFDIAPGYYPFIGFSAESEAINPEQPVRA